MPKLPDHWIDLAAAHGSTKWVKRFIQTYLPQLEQKMISAQQFAHHLTQALESRNLSTLAQQKNYRSNVVQALKVLDEHHPAISLVALSPEQYQELNDQQRGKLADRSTQYLTSDQAEELVHRATGLLGSSQWSEVGAGLAVLIGRRISEILLSQFELKTPWSLNFTGMAKKAQDQGMIIEIPTLAPATPVMRAIERLQKGLKIDDLKGTSLSPKMAKQAVNARFSSAISGKCEEYFSDLVPPRTDKDNLYTHIFRAVYATIAAHWFCPPQVPEHSFKAEIQGHFTIGSEGRKLPNFSARANYDDYAIGDGTGNRDGRLGIKLGSLPGLKVIGAFQSPESPPSDSNAISHPDIPDIPAIALPDTPAIPLEPTFEPTVNTPDSAPEEPPMKRPLLYAHDVGEMISLMARQGVTGSPAEVFHAFVEMFKATTAQQQQQQMQSMTELTGSLQWFIERIQKLEKTCELLQKEREQFQGESGTTAEIERLQAENDGLRQQLLDTQSRLEKIQQLIAGNGGRESSSQPVITELGMGSPVPSPRQVQVQAPRKPRGDSADKLNHIIDALLRWNTSQEDGDTQLRVSIPVVKALASAMGANYQPAIQQVLKDREEELDEHHGRLLIGTRHNASVKDKDGVLQQIARDYLGLDNWQEVKYTG